jgi:GMP synthase-like glutamine amidotransferase
LSAKTSIKGLILSGGKGNPFEPLNLTSNFVALNCFDVPTIGFCLGHEIIAAAYRGRIKRLPEIHRRKEIIKIEQQDDPIFEGIEKTELSLVKRHSFHVSEIPHNFVSIASSETTPNEIIRHKEKPIYGFQAHPEASGVDGMAMINNFLKICGITE